MTPRWKRLKIFHRMAFGFASVLLLCAIMGGLTIRTMQIMSDSTQALYEHPFAVTQSVQNVRVMVTAIRADVLRVIVTQDASDLDRLVQLASRYDAETAHELETVRRQYLGPPQDLERLMASWEAWCQARDTRIDLLRQKNNVDASKGFSDERIMKFDVLIRNLDIIAAFAKAKALELQGQVDQSRRQAIFRISFMFAAMLVVGILMAHVITNSIVRPLDQMRTCMTRLSGGDLTVTMPPYQGEDEIAEMVRSVLFFRETAIALDQNRRVKDALVDLSLAIHSANSYESFGQMVLNALAPHLPSTLVSIFINGIDGKPCKVAECGRIDGPSGENHVLEITSRSGNLGRLEVTSASQLTALQTALIDASLPILSINLDLLKRSLELSQAQLELKTKTEKLDHAQAEMERFAEILAHHIQEPVRRQIIYAELLQKSLSHDIPDAAKVAVTYISEGANKLRLLVHDVQMYLEMDQQPTVTHMANTNASFQSAVRNVAEAIEQAGAEIDKPDLLPVWLDESRLTDLFSILLDNAIKYRSPDHQLKIRVETKLQPDGIVIGVIDNGIGIAPEHR